MSEQTQIQLMRILQTIIATLTIYISWGNDEPMFNFALVFGGFFIGHVLTEVLNELEGEE